ncbi:MAG: STAS domain-containing protein [Chloroflexota bacterium]
MEYSVDDTAGITVLNLSGEIDISHSTRLRDTLIEMIENNSGRLLIDLTNVSYIDSAGLSVLVVAHRKAQGMGGVLGLSNPQKSVQQVFQLTRMVKFFQIYDSVEAGVAALG